MRCFYDEVATKGNLDIIDELFSTDFVDNEVFPGLSNNREGVKQFFSMMHNAFDGFRMAVEDVLAEGDKAMARITMKGTHKGEFVGIAATGKSVPLFANEHTRTTNPAEAGSVLGRCIN